MSDECVDTETDRQTHVWTEIDADRERVKKKKKETLGRTETENDRQKTTNGGRDK